MVLPDSFQTGAQASLSWPRIQVQDLPGHMFQMEKVQGPCLLRQWHLVLADPLRQLRRQETPHMAFHRRQDQRLDNGA